MIIVVFMVVKNNSSTQVLLGSSVIVSVLDKKLEALAWDHPWVTWLPIMEYVLQLLVARLHNLRLWSFEIILVDFEVSNWG